MNFKNFKKGFFISGTDTDVGKTWVTVSLLKQLVNNNIKGLGMKPVSCGDREDAIKILNSSYRKDYSLDLINPIFFPNPVSPASDPSFKSINFDDLYIKQKNLAKDSDLILIEGAGGWLTPFNYKIKMADIAKKFNYPTILVSSNKLGTLNHTLLTFYSILNYKINCPAIYLNTIPGIEDSSQNTNEKVLRKLIPKETKIIRDDINKLSKFVISLMH